MVATRTSMQRGTTTPRYFVGRSCRNGHGTKRYVATGACVECHRNAQRANRLRDPTKAKQRRGAWAARLRIEALTRLGGKCRCCGETTEEFLTFDHHKGGGRAHRATYSNPSQFYRWLVVTPLREVKAVIRLLCWNCNGSFGTRGYCPHRRASRIRHAA